MEKISLPFNTGVLWANKGVMPVPKAKTWPKSLWFLGGILVSADVPGALQIIRIFKSSFYVFFYK